MNRLATIVAFASVWAATGSAFAADPVAFEATTRTAAEWYAMGGAAMHGLALCSVVVCAAIIDRLWALRPKAVLPHLLREEIKGSIRTGHFSELKSWAEAGDSAMARLIAAALRSGSTREEVESQGAAEVHTLRRNLGVLAAAGNLATMIGLLGTVLGMIEAFDVIAVAGSGDAAIVAGGIFRALVTTAGGLGVGIVALAAHAGLSRRVDDQCAALESLSAEFFSRVHSDATERSVEFDASVDESL